MKHASGFVDLVNAAKRRIAEITLEDVIQKRERGESFLLVDVREDDEWREGHIPESIHLGKGVIERDIERVIPDREAAIVLYCGGGFRSALAAESLQRMGYTNVASMDGGIKAWRERELGEER